MAGEKAEDIMIPLEDYPHIPYWFTLRQAVVEMEKSVIDFDGRRSLPMALLVFDEKYDLVGIVRRRDILRGLEPKFLRTMSIPNRRQMFDIEADPDLVDLSSGKVGQEMRERANQPVSEVMQSIACSVDCEDHIAKIIYRMLTHDLNLLPVLKGEEVVGVVRSVDVFREIAEHLL